LPVEGVGKPQVEGEMMARVRIELRPAHPVEALRRLPVAFAQLGPKVTGEPADLIVAEQRKACRRAGAKVRAASRV
jgi:hypothetical protein